MYVHELIRFFGVHPTYQDMFPTLRNLTKDELRTSSKLRAHASVVMNNIDALIGNLTDAECVEEIILKIVRTHAPRGVKQQHFQVQLLCLIYKDKNRGKS